jgi:hypothetical protein
MLAASVLMASEKKMKCRLCGFRSGYYQYSARQDAERASSE